MTTSRIVLLALIGIGLAAGGCGTGLQRAAVSGEVLVDKVPLAEGTINFFPTEGNEGPSAGIPIKDGKYTLPAADGAIVGKNLVKITGFRKTGKKVPDAIDKTKMIDEQERAVGEEYNEKSTLVRDINAGANTLNFDLPGLKK